MTFWAAFIGLFGLHVHEWTYFVEYEEFQVGWWEHVYVDQMRECRCGVIELWLEVPQVGATCRGWIEV